MEGSPTKQQYRGPPRRGRWRDALPRWPRRRIGRRWHARRGGGIGIFGILILLGVCWLLGINPLALLSGELDAGGGYVEQQQRRNPTGGGGTSRARRRRRLKEFVAVVLAETEDTWNELLPQVGAAYREPRLVLFSGGANSACGFAQSAVGPFYCPADEKVYLDLDFFDELSRRLGAPGDFAQAYVIAHEVGHHVQKVLGIEDQVRQARASMSETRSQRAVRAGRAAGRLLRRRVGATMPTRNAGCSSPATSRKRSAPPAPSATIRCRSRQPAASCRTASPTARRQQRTRWFETGYRSGNVKDCDTFNASSSRIVPTISSVADRWETAMPVERRSAHENSRGAARADVSG